MLMYDGYMPFVGIDGDIRFGVMDYIEKLIGRVICENNLHLLKSKSCTLRKGNKKFFYIQKNWYWLPPDSVMDTRPTLGYDLVFKFTNERNKFYKIISAILEKKQSDFTGLLVDVMTQYSSIVSITLEWPIGNDIETLQDLSYGSPVMPGTDSLGMLYRLYNLGEGYLR